MGCKPCQERKRIVLAQQSKQLNNNIMAKDKKVGEDEFQESENPVIVNDDNNVTKAVKLDVAKLVADRRAKLESGKIINK